MSGHAGESGGGDAEAGHGALRALFVHSGNIFGGVEGLLLAVARHHRAAPGFFPEFAVAFDGRFRRELDASGVTVHEIGPVRVRRPDLVWGARRRVTALVVERSIDVVVTQSGWSHAIFAAAASAAGVPLVRWVHGLPNRHWLEWVAARYPPVLIIANSHFTASAVSATAPGVPVRVCYGPVHLEDQRGDRLAARATVRSSLGASDTALVIVQVGRMEGSKGHRVHLEALAQLDARVDWECWMVGAPQCRDEERYVSRLEADTGRLGLGRRVRWLGARRDVAAVLTAADLYCQPNIAPDTFGLTFIEAMAAGLPVVTSAIGGGAELVDTSCGHLVPPGDVAALAGVLSRLLADPAERACLGAAGPARARRLADPSVQVPVLAGLLREAARVSHPAA